LECRETQPKDNTDDALWDYWQQVKETKNARLILERLQDGSSYYLSAIAGCESREDLVDAVDEAWASQCAEAEPREDFGHFGEMGMHED